MAQKLAEVKNETHVTILPKRKAKALIDTLPARLANVKIATQHDGGSKIRRGVYQ